jgi:hypothetical protein
MARADIEATRATVWMRAFRTSGGSEDRNVSKLSLLRQILFQWIDVIGRAPLRKMIYCETVNNLIITEDCELQDIP